MPRLHMTEHEREAFLAESHIGVLSVANREGRPPLTVPIWYNYQPGGNITFFTGTAGRKARKTDLIRKASVVIEKDEHGFYAWCPELKGCQSQGNTLEETVANIKA